MAKMIIFRKWRPFLSKKTVEKANFDRFSYQNGRLNGKKGIMKKMVDKVLDTYLGIILIKLQSFTIDTHRGNVIFVKCQKITKNCACAPVKNAYEYYQKCQL